MKRLIAIILILIGPLLFCRQTETQNNQSLPYWCRPQSNWFKHVGRVIGRHLSLFYGLIDYDKLGGFPNPLFYSDSIPQSIADGRFLGKYKIVSAVSDFPELLPVLNFPEIFAEKTRYYDPFTDKIVTTEDAFIIVMPFVEDGDSIHFNYFNHDKYKGMYTDCILEPAYYCKIRKSRGLVLYSPRNYLDFEHSDDTLKFVFYYTNSKFDSDGYPVWNNSTVLTIAKDKSFVPEQ